MLHHQLAIYVLKLKVEKNTQVQQNVFAAEKLAKTDRIHIAAGAKQRHHCACTMR